MSTLSKQSSRYILVILVGLSTWLVACCISYEVSILSGGRQRENASKITKEIIELRLVSPACEALATKLVEAGLKARAAVWMPTSQRLKSKEDEAAKLYEEGACPVGILPVLAFAVARQANDMERTRVKARDERW
jgi:hypothetical protein